jgi:hypothetical protein
MISSTKTFGAALLVLTAILAGCQSQRTFKTPDEAVAALASAAERGDRDEVRRIFGPRARELRSDDPEQDALDLASFKRALTEARKVEKQGDDQATLLVGDAGWPFAVPLVRQKDHWVFDTAAGVEELENRRIGRNEIRTMAALRTLIDAQTEYASVDRDGDGVKCYAGKLMSSPGTKDGLYWDSPGGVDPSPIGPVLAEAATQRDESGARLPYNGYRFRLLTRQGAGAPGGAKDYIRDGRLVDGWAVIAWPAEYDHTGVMSFIASADGVIYERDLGPETQKAVDAISEFDPSNGWKRPGT